MQVSYVTRVQPANSLARLSRCHRASIQSRGYETKRKKDLAINYLHNNSNRSARPAAYIPCILTLSRTLSRNALLYLASLLSASLIIFFFFYLKCYIEISSFWVPHNFVSLATTMARTTWPSSQDDKNCALLMKKNSLQENRTMRFQWLNRISHISFLRI